MTNYRNSKIIDMTNYRNLKLIDMKNYRNSKYLERYEDVVFELETALNSNIV